MTLLARSESGQTGSAGACQPRQTQRLKASVLALGLALSGACQALDYGPFTLTGFAKAEASRGSNHCIDCQRFPEENKQRLWADELVPGQPYKTTNSSVTLFQPWLLAKFDLGQGFRLTGMISQRLRDGRIDIPGFWYEKNVAVSHEDYGRVAFGAMTTRAWSLADYPYGTNIGLADVWGSSGAGYGLNTNAIRYTSRLFDVAAGDLSLEATYDMGDRDFKVNKPRFIELFARYKRDDLMLDAIVQDTHNGNPQSWSHGPFTSIAYDPADDKKLGGASQGIAMLMARYQIDSRFEAMAGVRVNRWSGANAVLTTPRSATQPYDSWNNMFNVDWGGVRNGVNNPGYSARSTDFSAGLRYKKGQWTAHTGLAYLGKATTANPSERGQSNSALVNTAGLGYDFGRGLQGYLMTGMVHYGRLGLAPMSMPDNSAFTGVDSRVAKSGNWAGLGAVYVF